MELDEFKAKLATLPASMLLKGVVTTVEAELPAAALIQVAGPDGNVNVELVFRSHGMPEALRSQVLEWIRTRGEVPV